MSPNGRCSRLTWCSGAGKSTLSRAIVEAFPSFSLVSIDAIIGARHGIYNVDYPPSEYAAHQAEARQVFLETVQMLLRRRENMVLDRSFYAKQDRDAYKSIVEKAGGRWILVYLNAKRRLLWERICERREKGVDADSALEISEELLDQYIEGFEVPRGEGEIVIQVS